MTLPNAAVAKRQVPPDSEAKEKIGDVQKKLTFDARPGAIRTRLEKVE